MRLERALLLEKLEEKTPAHVDDSEGSESESSVRRLSQTLLSLSFVLSSLFRSLNSLLWPDCLG
jgi:hypothetical protein